MTVAETVTTTETAVMTVTIRKPMQTPVPMTSH
jgi:hypothetical protein